MRALVLAVALILAAVGRAQEPTRVACLGDSITYGALLPDREHLSYPAQLADRLGPGFDVRNFGASSRTMLVQGDLPYVGSDEWTAARAWRPDVAVVILGTNDTVADGRGNWEHAAHLERDARALCTWLGEAGATRILLCTPPPMYADAPGLDDERRAALARRIPRLARIRDAYAAVARESDAVELIDLARVFGPERTVDGGHPDPFGAELLADRIAEVLSRRPAASIDFALRRRALDGEVARTSDASGFAQHTFGIYREDGECTVVAPHAGVLAPGLGRPWIALESLERAPAGLLLDLLDRGFHVVASADADARGELAERRAWERLHTMMTTFGLGWNALVLERDPATSQLVLRVTGRVVPRDEVEQAAPATLRAALAAVGLTRNPATLAHPSAEWRSGAGWGTRSWRDEVDAMRALAEAHPELEIAFLGDSITQGLTGAADRLSRAGGKRSFDRVPDAISLGLSGDRTEHVLWRIEHGALRGFDPRVIVLQIGVNNVNAAGHTADETAEGIDAIARSLRRNEPQASVLICGPFPAHGPDHAVRRALDDVHARIAGLEVVEGIEVVDLRSLFLDADGALNDRMSADGIHVSPAGQAAWIDALAPRIAELLEP